MRKEYKELYEPYKGKRRTIEKGEDYELDLLKEDFSGGRFLTPEKRRELDQKVIERVERKPSPRALQKITKRMIEESSSDLEPLQHIGVRITGNLFDRVDFLKTRIAELEVALQNRERLHRALVGELDRDIEDREKMLTAISKLDDQREIKLDLSLLKMEKRKEMMAFWRDVTLLRKELRELKERFENELKIARLFSEIKVVS